MVSGGVSVIAGHSTCLHLSSWLPSPGSEAAVLPRPENSSPAQLWRVWGEVGVRLGGEAAIGQKKINMSKKQNENKRNERIKEGLKGKQERRRCQRPNW